MANTDHSFFPRRRGQSLPHGKCMHITYVMLITAFIIITIIIISIVPALIIVIIIISIVSIIIVAIDIEGFASCLAVFFLLYC